MSCIPVKELLKTSHDALTHEKIISACNQNKVNLTAMGQQSFDELAKFLSSSPAGDKLQRLYLPLKPLNKERLSPILANCTAIKHLGVVVTAENNPLDSLKHTPHLTSLTVKCSEITSVEFIQQLPDLETLTFLCCSGLENIDLTPLLSHPSLRVIELNSCENQKGLKLDGRDGLSVFKH